MSRIRYCLWTFLLLGPASAWAWQASAPVCADGQYPVRFTTSEISAVDLDISPDGERMAFSMLGDVYIASTHGGNATAITTGLDWDARPVWSPDGRHVTFISDRTGSDQVFVVKPDAPGHLRQVTPDGKDRALEGFVQAAEWTPDSTALVVGGMRYPVQGGPPSAIPGTTPTSLFHGNGKDLHAFARTKALSGASPQAVKGHSYALWHLAADGLQDTGERIGPVLARAEAPVVTRDGRWIVYRGLSSAAGADASVDVLRVRDRRSGRDRVLLEPGSTPGWRSHGRVEGFPTAGRFAASPDSRHVFFGYDGRIQRIDLETGESIPIPLTVDVAQCLVATVRNEVRVDHDQVRVRGMRGATLRPDGKALLFSALRKLRVLDIPGGKPRLFVPQDDGHGQFQPAYSPDGQWVAYVSWSEAAGGHVWRVPAGGGTPVRLTASPGRYQHPVWSPDGRSIAFVGSADARVRPGKTSRVSAGYLHVVLSSGGPVSRLEPRVRMSHPPGFTADGARLLYAPYIDDVNTRMGLHSLSLESGETRNEGLDAILPRGGTDRAVLSPDGRLVAVVKQGNLHLVRCAQAIGSVGFRVDDCVQAQMTRAGGDDPRWRRDGAELEWSFADVHYRAGTRDLLAWMDAVLAGGKAGPRVDEQPIDLTVPRHRGGGTLVLRGARLITMRGDEVIENGAVRVEDGVIVQIGAAGDVDVPPGATIMDLAGKTIMPGLVDAHAHLWDLPHGLLDASHGEALVYLAFGVTTVRDPDHGGDQNLAYAELIDAGAMIGPRMFSTNSLMIGGIAIDSYEDAVAIARRTRRLGGTFLKYHSGWDRRQRRWIIEAARQEQLNVAAHFPMSNYAPGRMDLSTVVDGATTLEHDLGGLFDVFDDAVSLLAASGSNIDFASIAAHGGYPGMYWNAASADPRMRNFYVGRTPKAIVAGAEVMLTGSLAALEPQAAANADLIARIQARGGTVSIGSHGDYDGIGLHLEMWAHVAGGMTAHDVLRAATLNGARAIGAETGLGSIEPGKVADLLVLGRNPLDDIRNTLNVEGVMKDGVLRQAETLEQAWPTR